MSKKTVYPIVKYNDAGLEVYREEINGYWVKRKYDAAGRQTYWETNRGGWARHKYDDDGREIYYENSDGFWFKAEYSQSGFRTYYEDSTGKVQTYKEKSVSDVLKNAEERSEQTASSVAVQDKTNVDYVKEQEQ